MLKRFLISLFLVLILGGILVYFAHLYLVDRHQQMLKYAQNDRRKDIQITIIEGKRREEIAAQLAKAGICNYQDFLVASEGLEGKLFPDTYRFFPNTPAKDIVQEMENDYLNRTANLKPTKDQLILASIIEREALYDADRAGIAAVYLNRLKAGMRLGSDPTVQYAKDTYNYLQSGSQASFVFWQPITQADYQTAPGPYNTYQNSGLPPGPICSPGLKSIEAAINPATSSNLYFLYKKGQIYYSQTLAEHLQQANQ